MANVPVPAPRGKIDFPPSPVEGEVVPYSDITYVYQKWGAWKAVYDAPAAGAAYTGTNGVGFTDGSTTQFQANIVGLTTR